MAQHIERPYNGNQSQEDEQVGIGEEIDERRDGVVGGDAVEELALMNPSQCQSILATTPEMAFLPYCAVSNDQRD